MRRRSYSVALALGVMSIFALPAYAQNGAADTDRAAPEPAAPEPAAADRGPAADRRPAANRAPAPEIAAIEPAVDVGADAPASGRASASRAVVQSRVMDTLDLGTTSITGNQELPKVLYIVPWKSSDLGDLVGRPVNTLLDEVLAPVDPEVFQRHLDYYEALYGNHQEE
jgi:hypothetical protein